MTEQQYQAAIRSLEDEAQQSRGFRASIAAFINNPAYDLHTRRALAEHIGLPAPRQESPTHG